MRVEPAASLVGHVVVPGDKSISHRAVLIGALGEGETRVHGFGRSGDTQASVDAVRSLGVTVEDVADDELVVQGAGLRGLRAGTVDCRNAGTLMRLLSGVLAGQEGEFTLTGDESLTPRPMERVAAPLRRMGAEVETTDGHAPLVVRGSGALRGIEIEPEVASAQVKSAILLAGLNADGPTTVVERIPTRDHTERMLEAAGIRVRRSSSSVTVEPAGALRLEEVVVPGDFSSAAPLLVAAALVPGSDLTIHDLGVNPRRTGLLDVLERMGARVSVFDRRREGGEPVASVQVQHGRARGDGDRRRRGAGPRRRAAARRAPRLPRARRDTSLRCRRAAREGDATASRRSPTDCGRSAPGSTRGPTAGPSPASLLGCAAAGSTRAATTGSPCSAPSRGSPRARVSRSRAPTRQL